MTERTFTEKDMIDMRAQIERETAISVAGNSVLTKCLGYINDDMKQGRCTKLEYDVLVMIYNQFMAPKGMPAPQPPAEPVDEEPKEE